MHKPVFDNQKQTCSLNGKITSNKLADHYFWLSWEKKW